MLAQSAQIYFCRKTGCFIYVWQPVFNWVLYHWTILALFVQCWLGSSFTACGTTMNTGQLWLEQCNTSHQDSVEMERFWNLQHSKYHNGAKMTERWNVSKLTAARTKMEVLKLRTKVTQWWGWCHNQTKWAQMQRRPILISELVYEICNIQYACFDSML